MKNTDKKSKLLEYLKSKNLYGVVWYGHFNTWFITYSFEDERCPVDHIDIYTAYFEEYYDKYNTLAPISTIKILHEESWSSILLKLIIEFG